jgi:hypothetical protein
MSEVKPQQRRHAVIFAVLLIIVVLELLNFTGFCYREGRYPSDQQLIDSVIQYEIDHIDPQHLAGAKRYTSVEDFRHDNPHCCRLSKWGDPYVGVWERRWTIWLRRLFGAEIYIADLWFRSRDEGPRQFSIAHYLIDACGNVREHAGGGGQGDQLNGATREWQRVGAK